MQILTYFWSIFLIGYMSAGCFSLGVYHSISNTAAPGNDHTRFLLLPIYVAFWPAVFFWNFGSAIGKQLRIRRVSEKMAQAEIEE